MTPVNRPTRIGISIGDINGVGPEVILKVFNNPDMLSLCTPVVFANHKVLEFYKKSLKDIKVNFSIIKSMNDVKQNKFNVFECWQEDVNVEPGVENETGGKYAVRSLEVACQCLKSDEIDVLVTAPIGKKNTNGPNFKYSGHTPYLRDFFGADDVAMILYTDELKVCPLTGHIAVSEIPAYLNQQKIRTRLKTLFASLRQDFALDKPKIAVLGLNPHNGDRGLYGTEEAEIIYPVIEEFRQNGELVVGPFAADSFFNRGLYKKFDLCLGMYHDQVLIPFKLMDDDRGVNFTAGMDYIRTSPDHGTGYDIAGQDIANPDSMRGAIFAAMDLYASRSSYVTYTANPLKPQSAKSKD